MENVQIPAILIKYRGRASGIKTEITNIFNISKYFNINPHYIMKFFGYRHAAYSKLDEKKHIQYICGRHSADDLQESLKIFISQFVLCHQCQGRNTVLIVNETLHQKCKDKECGNNTEISSDSKIKQYIIKHMLCNIDKQMKSTFLRGFRNSKSIQENVMLLFHGYIHTKAKTFKTFVPDEIINMCLSFCLPLHLLYGNMNQSKWVSCDRNDDVNDDLSTVNGVYYDFYDNKWKRYDNGVTMLDKFERMVKLQMGNERVPFILKTQRVSIEIVRKVWNIKINHTLMHGMRMKVSVVSMDQDTCYEYEIEIDSNEFVVSVLLLVFEDKRGWIKISTNTDKAMSVSITALLKSEEYCVQLILSNSCTVQLLD